jgi:hypothetical protein
VADPEQPENPSFESVPSEPENSILDLREEIDTLTRQQNNARRNAAHGGMTTDEAKEYDARREKISRLVEQYLRFQRPLR